MINPLHIVQGWINDAIKTDNWEKVSSLRMAICNDCPELDLEGTKCKVPGTAPCCGACGCPLAKKTRSNSTCPLAKW